MATAALRSSEWDGTREALVVACERFPDPQLAPVPWPARGARALGSVLGSPAIEGFEAELSVNPPLRAVLEALPAVFGSTSEDGLVPVYWAAHVVHAALLEEPYAD